MGYEAAMLEQARHHACHTPGQPNIQERVPRSPLSQVQKPLVSKAHLSFCFER
jgi:hypothetical protein